MPKPKMPPSLETIIIAEKLLSEAFGGSVRLNEGEDLAGSNRTQVYRFRVLEGPGDVPATVIVKQAYSTADAVYHPDTATIPAWTFFNEWASLQFLSQIAADEVPFGPKFYVGERAAGLLIMEDIGQGIRLDHFLLGDDSVTAEKALIEFAALHGRMHALSIGKQSEFASIRKALGPSELADGYYHYDWFAPTLQHTAETAGITTGHGVESELELLKETLLNPGPFLAFTQGDSCPDNCLWSNSSMRLLDFEGGMFSHALKEGVYGRIHFPTCWCVYRMPEHVPLRMEEAYRAELVKGCPAAADDRLFYHAVVEACALWMLDWYHEFPLAQLLEQDRMIVTSTVRQRFLMRSEILARTTEEFGHLEAFGETVRAIATKLSEVWTPDEYAMPYYPAFR
ncbi:MAG TPA: hypothetical protein VF026_11320 [Ktedonobacteraceae bacterium]